MSAAASREEETPLSRLGKPRGRGTRAFLDAGELDAGERLRVDWTRGSLMPNVSQSWDWMPRGSGRNGAGDLSDHALDARRRVKDALEAVGPELSGLLLDVCCFLKGLETVERERQWPARSAKLLLKTGLAILARHYGLGANENRYGRLRSWAAPGARPRTRERTSGGAG